ncbi:hypothetical protein Fcan01_20994 [Folsomia candida]|uniref:Uncharacterized protein n=1 Tax=Folsomia candida TaxID=158441 RepID=A0A226DI43_FOLCA|nr:hypothetical protein Fcan01_20994 [Folsomia candida]
MPNVVTLFAADIYQIQNCLDETHLPNLKHLTLDKSFQFPCEYEKFSETLVQVFPNVKRFDFTAWYVGLVQIEQFTKFMEPFKGWNFEKANLSFVRVIDPPGQTILAALRSMATWNGVKTAKFCFHPNKADFTAHVDDFIRYSGGFQMVKMRQDSFLWGADPEFIQEMQAIFEARNAPISIEVAHD